MTMSEGIFSLPSNTKISEIEQETTEIEQISNESNKSQSLIDESGNIYMCTKNISKLS